MEMPTPFLISTRCTPSSIFIEHANVMKTAHRKWAPNHSRVSSPLSVSSIPLSIGMICCSQYSLCVEGMFWANRTWRTFDYLHSVKRPRNSRHSSVWLSFHSAWTMTVEEVHEGKKDIEMTTIPSSHSSNKQTVTPVVGQLLYCTDSIGSRGL